MITRNRRTDNRNEHAWSLCVWRQNTRRQNRMLQTVHVLCDIARFRVLVNNTYAYIQMSFTTAVTGMIDAGSDWFADVHKRQKQTQPAIATSREYKHGCVSSKGIISHKIRIFSVYRCAKMSCSVLSLRKTSKFECWRNFVCRRLSAWTMSVDAWLPWQNYWLSHL